MAKRKWLKSAVIGIYRPLYPLLERVGLAKRAKHLYEATYWRRRAAVEGQLNNDQYHMIYTAYLGLDDSFYAGKKILDIGCGPRGSLEWADMAAERVGLDPLVPVYREMGIDKHKMRYVDAPSEKIPFPDDYFDVILALNSFDHVDNLEQTISEISRVTALDGCFVLMVEVNHEATIAEPHQLNWGIVKQFPQVMQVSEEHHYEEAPDGPGVTAAMRAKIPYNHANPTHRSGALVAKFVKTQPA